MSDEKYVNIARLMTSYNFEIKKLPDNLKCTKCKLVLKDACQVPCGCTFCRVCINDMIMKDGEFCPGLSEYCAESRLPLFKSDYKSNNSVSKLSVKCPHYGCVHDCLLINIEEHMRECQRRTVECPFRDFGCKRDKLIAEEVDLHWQQDYRRHSEILIGMVANINTEMEDMKREIGILKQREENRIEIDILNASDEAHRREIERMNRDLIEKTEQIQTMRDQMDHVENENKSIRNDLKSIQEEKEDLAARVRILSEKIEQEIEDRRQSDELGRARVIEHTDKEMSEVTGLIGSIKDELVAEMNAIRDRSINEGAHSTKEVICPMTSQVQSIQALVGHVDASCEWLIGEDVGKINWIKNDKMSNCFTGDRLQYRYQLASWNGRGELWICLRILPTPFDWSLAWPFEGRVVITVRDRNRSQLCRSKSKQCKIERPSDNEYEIRDYFKFRHSELIGTKLNLSCGVLVTCVIVPEAGR